MRWKTPAPKKYPPEPKLGDRKIIKTFLFFPKSLRGPLSTEPETRWLEFARINQKFEDVGLFGSEMLKWTDQFWED